MAWNLTLRYIRLDLTGFQRIDDDRKADKEVVFCLFRVNAVFQPLGEIGEAGFEGLFCASGDFVSHEDANGRHGLPCVVQRQQSADFEEAGSGVHGFGSESPLFEAVKDFSLGALLSMMKNSGSGLFMSVGLEVVDGSEMDWRKGWLAACVAGRFFS